MSLLEDTLLMPSISAVPCILIVDADPVARADLMHELEQLGYPTTAVSGGEDALESLKINFTPLVIMDRRLPGLDGLEFCRRVRAQQWPGYLYLIVRAIEETEADVIEGLVAGADEYLSKSSSHALLVARLKTARRILAQEQALKHVLAERRQMSLTDALTVAHNRRYLMKYGERAVRAAQLRGESLCVLALDIDHFKSVNDRHGHDVGDSVLIELVRRIHGLLRKHEWCARMGSEEFGVILPRSDLVRAQCVAERMRKASISLPYRACDVKLELTVSIGVAGLNEFERPSEVDLSVLLRQADSGLYQSKRTGRDRVSLAPDAQIARGRG